MASLIVRTDPAAPDTLIPDMGIEVPGAGGTATLTLFDELQSARESRDLVRLATDDAYGVGASTLILNNGTVDIPQADVLIFLPTMPYGVTGPYSIPVRDDTGEDTNLFTYTPTFFTPTADTANGYMEGLDNAFESLSVPQRITVYLADGDFTSIAAAMASITDSSITKPYEIVVGPGVYTEDTITCKPYVLIRGSGFYTTVVKAQYNDRHLIVGALGSSLYEIAVEGPTDTGFAAVYHATSGTTPFILRQVLIRSGYYGVWSHHATARTLVHLKFTGNHYIGSAMNQFLRSTGYGNITAIGTAFMSGPSGAVATGFYASGANAEMTLDLCAHRNAGSVGLVADDGATVRLTACTFTRGTTAIQVGSVGTGTEVIAAGCVITDSYTTDIDIQNVNSTVDYSGAAHRSKISNVGGVISASFTDNDAPDSGQVVLGELWLGSGTETVPVRRYALDTYYTGLESGGVVTYGTGFDVDVAAGSGFINTGTAVTYITWAATSVTCGSGAWWIYVNGAGVVSAATSEPDITLNIILSACYGGSTALVAMSEHKTAVGQHIARHFAWIETVIGPLQITGLATTKHASPSLKMDVSSGAFYLGLQDLSFLTDVAPITFTLWRRDGSGGWVVTAGHTDVNVLNWDDGVTPLATLTTGYFRRDLLFCAISGDGPEFHLVLGQEEFATQNDALNGPNPAVFGALNTYACRLAAILVQESATDIADIVDERPHVGQQATGVTAITVHSGLSGLSADDHPQYLPVSGTRAMTGDLNMGTKNITNVGTVDGVTVSSHVARHQPGGSDALAVGAPVTIGTTNAGGSSNNLARADHVHDHGAQTSGTLHAVATTSVAGFESAADKTKLDGIATGATNTPLTSSAPANVTKAAAVVGVATAAARADHKHDITTAAPAATGVATTSGEGAATTLARSNHTHQSNTAPVNVTKATAAIGTSGEPARADHKHDVSTAAAVAVGTANGEGSATSLARSDHTHQVTGLTITSQAQGDILYFNGTNWVRLAPGTSGNFLQTAGAGANPAWVSPLTASAPANVTKAAAAAGTATDAARADHKHDITTAAAVGVGTANAEGSATTLARSDHTHQVTGLTISGQVQGDILYFNGTSWVRLAPGTAGQVLQTQGAGANPAWAGGPAYADYYNSIAYAGITTAASTLPLNTTRQSNADFTLAANQVTINTTGTYRVDFDMSMGDASTTDITVDLWLEVDGVEVPGTRARCFHDDNTEEGSCHGMGILSLTATNVLRLRGQVVSGTDQCDTRANGTRLVIHAIGSNGPTGATGPTGPTGSGSNIYVQDEGSTVPGGPHSTLNFVGPGVGVTDAGSGTARVAVYDRLELYADQLDNPVNSDWAVNALAPALAPATNPALTVRAFDDTTAEGVGFLLQIPSGVTSMTFRFASRAATAPAAARVVGLNLYRRQIPDNATVTAWSAALALTNIDIPANAFYQYDSQTITLATLGLTAGNWAQFELTRNPSPSGGTDLTGDWYLLSLIVEFT